MRKNENGYIVVETTVAFTLFILLVESILSLIGIVTVQVRVHYALTQTANELSMYSYVIETLGLTSTIKGLDKTAQEVDKKIQGVKDDLKTIEDSINDLKDYKVMSDTEKFFDNLKALVDTVEKIVGAGKSVGGTVKEVIENPKETFINVVRYGLDASKNYAMQEWVIRPMMKKYLANGGKNADEYLEAFGIIDGIDLSESVFIDENGDITIVASYDISYVFGKLPIPFQKIHVEQTAKTRAWLGGAD